MADNPTPVVDSMRSPQTIIALLGLGLVAATIGGVFWRGDTATQQLVIGIVIGSYGKDIFGFFFGSSAGSQRKDSTAPTPPAAPLVVTTVPTPEPQENTTHETR